MANCGARALFTSRNCGNNAVKNIIAFGLLTATPHACKKIFPDETDLAFKRVSDALFSAFLVKNCTSPI